MDLTEDQLQSAISEALERMDTLELLKRKAVVSGIAPVASACREFIKLGSRALVINVEKRVPIPRKLVEAAVKRQHWLCSDCDRELQVHTSGREDYATGDHSTARVQGGKLRSDNIRAICQSCNSKKGSKDAIEYSKHTGHLMTRLAVETESIDS